jgi:hypothetical protein
MVVQVQAELEVQVEPGAQAGQAEHMVHRAPLVLAAQPAVQVLQVKMVHPVAQALQVKMEQGVHLVQGVHQVQEVHLDLAVIHRKFKELLQTQLIFLLLPVPLQ